MRVEIREQEMSVLGTLPPPYHGVAAVVHILRTIPQISESVSRRVVCFLRVVLCTEAGQDVSRFFHLFVLLVHQLRNNGNAAQIISVAACYTIYRQAPRD